MNRAKGPIRERAGRVNRAGTGVGLKAGDHVGESLSAARKRKRCWSVPSLGPVHADVLQEPTHAFVSRPLPCSADSDKMEGQNGYVARRTCCSLSPALAAGMLFGQVDTVHRGVRYEDVGGGDMIRAILHRQGHSQAPLAPSRVDAHFPASGKAVGYLPGPT